MDPDNADNYTGGTVSRLGNEVWCNLRGNFVSIVADLTRYVG